LLRNRLSVAIGKWSYSIYLVHWPLYVFFLAYVFRTPQPWEQAALVAASVAAGWLQYRLVEERFRHGSAPRSWSRPAFAMGCALTGLIVVMPAAASWGRGGLPWRIPENRVMKTNAEWRSEE